MTEPKVVSNIVKIRKSALKRKERSENKSRKRAFRPSDGKKKKKKKKKRKIGKKFKTSGVVISRYVFSNVSNIFFVSSCRIVFPIDIFLFRMFYFVIICPTLL